MHEKATKALLGLLCVLLAAAAALADRKTLVLKDGRRVTGEVTKTPTGYRLERRLGTVIFSNDQVAKVEDATDPASEYARRRKKIDTGNAEELYDLAYWASENSLLKEARADLQDALAIKPDFDKAALLLKLVKTRLDRQEPTRPTRPDAATTRPGTSKLDKLLLSQDDVYRVRLAELDLWYEDRRLKGRDTRLTVKFRDDALNRFIDLVRGTDDFKQPRFEEAFKSFTPTQQVAIMLKYLGRDDTAIKDDILVRSDPFFMKEFRRTVWPILSQSCAQSQCHGGEKANGGMKLFTIAGKNERMDYTNFVILSGIRKKGYKRLIDRGEHTRSLLLEFGLPKEQAGQSRRHPKDIAPVYTSTRSANYRRVLAWIRSLKGPNHPDYRLDYKPPYGMVLHTDGRPDLPPSISTPPDGSSGKTAGE